MKQAIFCRYLPCTNTLPSRIVATCEGGRHVVSYNGDRSDYDPYVEAVRGLCAKMGQSWRGKFVRGGGQDGQVFVFADSDSVTI